MHKSILEYRKENCLTVTYLLNLLFHLWNCLETISQSDHFYLVQSPPKAISTILALHFRRAYIVWITLNDFSNRNNRKRLFSGKSGLSCMASLLWVLLFNHTMELNGITTTSLSIFLYSSCYSAFSNCLSKSNISCIFWRQPDFVAHCVL